MKKLIIRADDVGYTLANNEGVFKSIDEGVVTSADLMLDTPGSIDAMIRLKERPWISVGWHSHFWGSPVLDPSEVPSMVNAEGKFKFRHDQKLKDTCNPEEIKKEMRAQLDRCKRILGHVPNYTWINGEGVFAKAMQEICDEYGIITGFGTKPDRTGKITEAKEEYQSLHIYMPNQPAGYYQLCYNDSVKIRATYDPAQYYITDYDHLLEKETVLTAWHPGYLDDYIFNESSLHEGRLQDITALCSKELKNWIIENNIELVNTTDVLFGINEYQDHLKATHNSLYHKK